MNPTDPPRSTYRLQLHAGFSFEDAAARVPYLSRLGVTHVYLSPILQAAPGSTHGYDVVDHSRLSDELGGQEAFEGLRAALREHRMGAIVDVVPNHMSVPTPARLNAALWSVLRNGPASPYAPWFDIDWDGQPLLLPVLGSRIGQVLEAGELVVTDRAGEKVLRYYDHEFPVRPATDELPLDELVDSQWYRLAHWRVGAEELNYRRFFDIDTLAAVRAENPEVFDATHRLLLELVAEGTVTGLRIDHPDGLADPRGYLRRLAHRTGGAWVVVEKILEGDEELPPDWPCAGTTGYDALEQVGGLFVDPAGAEPLAALLADLTGETVGFAQVVREAKQAVLRDLLSAEVHRLTDLLAEVCQADIRLRDHTRRGLEEALIELLLSFGRYRAYVVPDEPAPPEATAIVEQAAQAAREHLAEHRHEALGLVVDLALGRQIGSRSQPAAEVRREFLVRFPQTCGPVMAKGMEDTAFYRWFRLAALNEVGGSPGRFGVTPDEFHRYAERIDRDWPATMTTLTTHDTKRSEDVRARLAVLSEIPAEWADAVRSWWAAAAPHRNPLLDPETEYLIWQTLVGTWRQAGPIDADRLLEYLRKATREAKLRTSWLSPQPEYEQAVEQFVTRLLSDSGLVAMVDEFVRAHADPMRCAVLAHKLVQLTMPGVPDTYQGAEVLAQTLVDPDNRQPVDYLEIDERLARLDSGTAPADLDDEKLLVTSRALRLRRELPEAFTGYTVLPTTSAHVVAFARGRAEQVDAPAVVTVVTRLPVALHRYGGWAGDSITLPPGDWFDVLSGRRASEATAELLAGLPVALLRRG